MYSYMTANVGKDQTQDTMAGTPWGKSEALDVMNSEAAVALRSVVAPIFQGASDWRELQKKLAQKGFGLTFRKGHMVLTDIATGVAICTGKFLGTPLKEMSARLGRPQIVALPGGLAGDFMH